MERMYCVCDIYVYVVEIWYIVVAIIYVLSKINCYYFTLFVFCVGPRALSVVVVAVADTPET